MLRRLTKPIVGTGLNWLETFLEELYRGRARFEPTQFTTHEHADGGQEISIRSSSVSNGGHHRFEVTPNLDEQGDFDGTITLHKGAIFGPAALGPSVPGGDDDPDTSFLKVAPQFRSEMLEQTVFASMGEKIWIDLLWGEAIERLGDEEADTKRTDLRVWALTLGQVGVGPDLPAPEFSPTFGTAASSLLIAELKEIDGQVAVLQHLHNDLAVNFPLLIDESLNPEPVFGEAPDEPDPEDPPNEAAITSTTSTPQPPSIVTALSSSGTSCVAVNQTTRPINYENVSFTIDGSSADGSNITSFGPPTSPTKVAEFKGC